MKIHLVRHGVSEWNLVGRWQGNADVPLSEIGRCQAEATAEELLNIAPSVSLLFSSDLKRARETAERIGKRLGLSPILRKDLRECNFSLWAGLTFEEVLKKYKEEFRLWSSNPRVSIEGLESLFELKDRTLKALEEIRQIAIDTSAAEVIVVGHGLWIRVLLCALLEMPLENHKRLDVANASITTIESHEQHGWILRTLNYHQHLAIVEEGICNKN
ncbi:histidine phosphatase family protein [Kosmotoga pacifica]|uniref:Phosphoglycerate mutase n=1 Tax=Kosmotoga pacifica TaxID=1330330 RepID=A0A0G2ZGC8_9BACT|nr:histidine phosphatase family protein [Kosmotoga pacifica]AKI97858.1 hypothetical protein IX53_08590 [Kosmotoga pacifica]